MLGQIDIKKPTTYQEWTQLYLAPKEVQTVSDEAFDVRSWKGEVLTDGDWQYYVTYEAKGRSLPEETGHLIYKGQEWEEVTPVAPGDILPTPFGNLIYEPGIARKSGWQKTSEAANRVPAEVVEVGANGKPKNKLLPALGVGAAILTFIGMSR